MRVMLDGITPSLVDQAVASTGATLTAGYVNGRWADYDDLVNALPHLRHVSITVNAQGVAVVLDVEKGDATPQEAPGWAQRMRAAGIEYPTVYVSMSAWQSVKDEFAAQGIAPPLYWIALYDNKAEIPAGAVAKQHTSTDGYDVSAVADYWPGVDPAPVPPAAVGTHLQEDSVQIEPRSIHPGEYAAIIPFGMGTLLLAADGYGDPGATFRVVLWVGNTPEVLPTVTVGGTSSTHIFTHATGTATAVTLRRLDVLNYPVALGFRP